MRKVSLVQAAPTTGGRLSPADAGGAVPLITFGIPAYSRPQLLAETLASIAAQTAAVDYEVVVCDDGTLAETAEVVARFPAERFFYHRNPPPRGAVGNWNECLRRARGRWVMILHEDDTLYPWYLEAVLPRLRDGLAALCTKVVSGATPPVVAPPSAARQPAVLDYPPLYFIKGAMTPFPGVLMSREISLRLGGFDERAGPVADFDFWYRLACAGEVEVVRCVGAFYRLADGQWTERAWPEMLRRSHLVRLRIAREQCRQLPRLGRWAARFYTSRIARAYAGRFPERPAGLSRAERLSRIPFGWLPSGWVWRGIRLAAFFTPGRR